ncbi:MAG TPA: hypothetical protein VNU26_14640 [Mycobacteriales bacterium]|nr:hypothetical protein [Mycobacteriales bacterium]
MTDTLLAFLTAKLKLAGVAVAAAALSTSAVAITTVSTEETIGEEVVAEQPLEPVVEEPVVGEPVVGEPVVEEPALEPVVEEGGDALVLPECTDEYTNHGMYVSAVARDRSVRGAEHGARVSAAAKSGCGKAGAGEDPVEEPVDGVEEPVDGVEEPVEEPVEEQAAAQRSPKKDKANGAGKAKGAGGAKKR